jgi:DNA repair protein RadC
MTERREFPTRLMKSRRAGEEDVWFENFEPPARPSDQHCAVCMFLKVLGMGPHAERMAAQMLNRYGSISAILQAPDAALEREFGLPHLAVAQLRSVAQLHNLALTEALPERVDLGTHSAVQGFFVGKLRHLSVEKCVAIFLDRQYCLIREEECSVGDSSFVSVEPRALIKAAILNEASAFVIAHNHPAGNADPSEDDIAFTQRLAHGAAAVGIELIDHVIVARNHLVSFAAENLIR